MAPVVEFCVFRSSDAYRSDPSIINGAAEIVLTKAEGSQFAYHGLQSEDAQTTYLLVGWESITHHHKLMSNKSLYDPLVSSLHVAINSNSNSNPVNLFHIQFHSSPDKALSAPTTEIALFTVNPAATQPDKGRLTQLMVQLEKIVSRSPGCYSCAWGPSPDREGVLAFVAGWDSPEAHLEVVKTNEELQSTAKNIFEIAQATITHVKLIPYPK